MDFSRNAKGSYTKMYFHYPTLFKVLGLTFSPPHFTPRHALLAIVFLLPFLLLFGFVQLMRLLDHLLFPGFRRQTIDKSIYIIGNPRSGTTFCHRLLAMDDQFTYLKLYQTIFPSVTCYKLFALAGRLDRRLGRPGSRLLNVISNRSFRGWDAIHKTGPDKAESDEMFFMYAMLSPLLGLLFPFFRELHGAMFVDRLPERSRQKLMAYYKSCLQRHLYATGPDKILLQKVALIAGRLGTIRELLPDLRVVHLVRHPHESIPSLISMFDVTWRALAPEARQGERAARELADLICSYYLYLHQLEQEFPPGQFVRIPYEELVADPYLTVQQIYRNFDLQASPEFNRLLRAETQKARTYKSEHHYSLEAYGVSEELISQRLQPLWDEYGFSGRSASAD